MLMNLQLITSCSKINKYILKSFGDRTGVVVYAFTDNEVWPRQNKDKLGQYNTKHVHQDLFW